MWTIRSSEELSKLLEALSPQWKDFIENGGDFTLILKACNTTGRVRKNERINFARNLSDDIEGLTVIAPNRLYIVRGFLGINWEGGIDSEGDDDVWNVYNNDELINTIKNYD